jgi:hypothetical protein
MSCFQKYKFIKGFEAIWSPELGVVEGAMQSDDTLRSTPMLINRIKRGFLTVNPEESAAERRERWSFEFPSPKENVKIIIGRSSTEFSILSSLTQELFYFDARIREKVTIRIEGLKISTHEEAKKQLSNISNSVFFQIDLKTNIPLHLCMDRDFFRGIQRKKNPSQEPPVFKAPKYEYDHEPMSLYWYARTARNMPLLQFLAFYQVLEFYFPLYSYRDAQQRIKNYLKNPTFDANKESDISHILDIVKVSSKGKSFGDEKDQFKATIMYCVDKSTMLDYLTEIQERKDFFDIQKKNHGLAKQKISFSSDNDIRIDVAQRIYEIRCRIVHTKDENELDLLLPFSLEIKNIKHDLELVEFLARQTIIAGGRQIIINN